ncbi:hypothetical protein [Oculatella sp. LEGE 06141]|uniref:hypothetical protein n=1 Tax=Oculatella sp. LEGE 06141 TaxID=1828648 RepID=UPI001D147E1B|nr:hypothetical protein [Oculatella sp. LEGE 06141]
MKKSSGSELKVSVQAVILAAIAWSTAALLFFLLFSVPLPGQGRPEWYGVTTYILEDIAFLGAGIMCFRNWRSSQIVSGRTVWLSIGLGMFSYFIGNLLLAYWELGLQLQPDVSPGDIFFIATYVFLGWGMLQAVLSRRLSLTAAQWATLAGIAIGSIALAYVLAFSPAEAAPQSLLTDPASTLVATTSPTIAQAEPVSPDVISQVEEASPPIPAWADSINETLAPLSNFVGILYIVGDIILVIIATTLLLAFWGGRFSVSWRFISAAALSFYIADMWFYYATNYIENYQTGALPEVFWIFSGCLFAIGAALEYDLSTRSRRGARKRT